MSCSLPSVVQQGDRCLCSMYTKVSPNCFLTKYNSPLCLFPTSLGSSGESYSSCRFHSCPQSLQHDTAFFCPQDSGIPPLTGALYFSAPCIWAPPCDSFPALWWWRNDKALLQALGEGDLGVPPGSGPALGIVCLSEQVLVSGGREAHGPRASPGEAMVPSWAQVKSANPHATCRLCKW